MNKILVILIAAVVVAVAAFGIIGSGAWFTDVETVALSGTAATLDLQLAVTDGTLPDGCDGTPQIADGGLPVGWTVPDLTPGTTHMLCIEVQNMDTGSNLAAKYRFRVADEEGDEELLPVTLAVEGGVCGDPESIYMGTVIGLNDADPPMGTDGSWNASLAPGSMDCYEFSIHVPESLGNEAQGTSGSINLIVDATQEDNPGWSEISPPTT